MTAAFSHVCLQVDDLDRAVLFYEQALGFTSSARIALGTSLNAFLGLEPGHNLWAHFLAKDGAQIELLGPLPALRHGDHLGFAIMAGLSHLSFQVESIAKAGDLFGSLGATQVDSTFTVLGVRVAFWRCPFGALIELIESPVTVTE